MRLRSRQFERALRRRLRPHDARRQMPLWHRFGHWLLTGWTTLTPNLFLRFGVTAFILLILSGIALDEPQSFQSPAWLGIIAAWALCVTTIRAGLYQTISAVDPVYRALWFLPLTSREIFRHLSRRILIASLFLFVEIAAAYIYISQNVTPGVPIPFALLFALLQVLICLALTLILLVINFRPEFHHGVFIVLGLWTIAAFSITDASPIFLQIATIPNPFAWVNALYTGFFAQQGALAGRYIVPLLVLLAMIPWTFRKVRLMHDAGVFRKKVIVKGGRPVVQNEEAPPRPKAVTREAESQGLAAELNLVHWNSSGVVERIFRLVLKPREKIIAQMLLSDRPSWNRCFYGLVIGFLFFLVANYDLDSDQIRRAFRGPPPNQSRILPFVLAVTGFLSIIVMLNRITRLFHWFNWPEPARNPRPGARMDMHMRIFPVNHWECLLVVAKTNLVSLLLIIPIAVLFSLTSWWQFLEENMFGAPKSVIPFLVMYWCATFFFPMFRFTPSFQDGFRYWPALIRDVMLQLVFLAGMAYAIFGPHNFWGACLIVTMTFFFISYVGKRYRQGK